MSGEELGQSRIKNSNAGKSSCVNGLWLRRLFKKEII